MDKQDDPFNIEPTINDVALAMMQPLIDVGWRLDYERNGIVRPGEFIPFAELKVAAEALEAMGPPTCNLSPYELTERRQQDAAKGSFFFSLDQLEAAVEALQFNGDGERARLAAIRNQNQKKGGAK